MGNIYRTYNSEWEIQRNIKSFETQLLWLVSTGITSWLDISLSTTGIYTSSHGKRSYLYGDTRLALGFQISKHRVRSWIPDIRLLILENFPSGKYEQLDPHKHLADISGSGSYETWIIAVTREIIYLTPRQPITINFTLQYNFPSNVHVKNYNLYGGDNQTNGWISPGNQFIGNLGIEYSLTINWILGLDIHYEHQNRSLPKRSDHSPSGLPSSEQFSLAPCIEYNPNPSFGIEVGSWFTFAGRNSSSFINGVTTIYWLF